MRISIFLFLSFTFSLCASELPTLKYRYAHVFDSWCSRLTAVNVTASEREQLKQLIPIFEKEWEGLGKKLLKQTTALFGKPFLDSDITGAIFLCKKTPSISFPLLLNGNIFLSKIGKGKSPKYMVYLTYHELLHSYLRQFEKEIRNSKAIQKYLVKGISNRTAMHLHLVAMQKYVYSSLGLTKELKELKEFESSLKDKSYEKAWDIAEGRDYKILISELRTFISG